MLEKYYTVSTLNERIKNTINSDAQLQYILLKGEISNFKHHFTGHLYFTLKDENSTISSIMFERDASMLKFEPKDGDEVLVRGKIGVYPQRGQYSIYIGEMELFGQGQALLEKERLKKKLQAEGLFDESKKRLINQYPKKIGIITASGSAALRDMIVNIHNRYPVAEIKVYPSLVQGDGAAKALLDAFIKATQEDIDTLIIGRGGGANEDLRAFDDETLARAVSKSPIPVISAVGHEIDFTIIDYVADKRVSTPTGAANAACIDKSEIEQRFIDFDVRVKNTIKYKFDNMKNDLVDSRDRLLLSIQNLLNDIKLRLVGEKKHLSALNPQNVLNRGYAIMEDVNGKLISDIDQVDKKQKVRTILKNGIITSEVIAKENK